MQRGQDGKCIREVKEAAHRLTEKVRLSCELD